MQLVYLQEEAFYALFDKVVEHIESKRKDMPSKWMVGEQVMDLLKIKSITTLQKYGMREKSDIPSLRRN